MADDNRGPTMPGGKRRRPPTTIDAKATEIVPEPVKPSEAVESTAETPHTETTVAASSVAEEPKVEPPQAAPVTKPAEGGGTSADAAALNDRMSASRAGIGEQAGWRFAVAGASGAAAMMVLFLALWGFGAFGNRDDAAAKLSGRIALLETNLRDLAAKPAPAGVDQRTVSELDARVTKVEQAATAPRGAQTDQALTGRVAALETSTRSLNELAQKVDAASVGARDARSRADAAFDAAQKNAAAPAALAADRKEIESLVARVAALEQAAKSTEDKIARAALTAGADRAGRLAFVTVALRSAVDRGDAFTQELAAVKPLVADAAALAPLEPSAATGVPRAAVLARELSQLAAPMLNANAAPRDGGFLDRLQQNAERLVRIRPINEAPGDDPATIVARADVKATHGDLSGALAELAQLPAGMRAPAQGWIKRAEAQVAALAAARNLAESAVGALGKAAP